MSNNPSLIGNRDGHFGRFIKDNTLTGQATFEARIERAINEILFFVGNFLNKILAALHIHVAGGASANAAAVVIEVNIVFFRDFQNGHILETSRHRLGRDFFIFKLELYRGHVCCCESTPI